MGRNGAAREGVWRGRLTDVPPIIDLGVGGTPPGRDALVGALTASIGVTATVLGVLLLRAGNLPAGVAMVAAGLAAVGQVMAVFAGRHVWSRLAVIIGGIAAVGFGMAFLGDGEILAGLVVAGLGAFAVGFAMATAAG